MNPRHELVNDIDLTFGTSEIPSEDRKSDPLEHLHPTQAMQDRFTQNCLELGIIRPVSN